ncbi:hypothetical protein FH972_015078 [Carpinus fangiana]|uniref:Uncharacterized protein n=1 Tax=Carpinus fangiana TaxID=176857 RepID=A0A5N6RBZ8_9ROSI|nr:hypothetical protein FH972_015078 [Carpinus fangiana]
MARLGDGGSPLQRLIPPREPFLAMKEVVPRSLLRRGFLKPQLLPAALGLSKECDFIPTMMVTTSTGKVSNVDLVKEFLKLVAMDHGGDFWVEEDSSEGIEDSTVLLPQKAWERQGSHSHAF